MTSYRKTYLNSHCIDLFFRYNGLAVHVLTDGNDIPNELNDRDRNRHIQSLVAQQAERKKDVFEECDINQKYIDYIVAIHGNRDNFPDEGVLLGMFMPMAELGFYSYDCIEQNADGQGRYMLVARPLNQISQDILIPEFESILRPVTKEGILLEFWM